MSAYAGTLQQRAGFFSVARYVAWRNLRDVTRAPVLIAPTLLIPLLFLIAFSGSLSRVAKLPDFGAIDYTAFQYVYALMQAAAFAGAVAGNAMTDDFVSGFMGRLMVTAPKRFAILVGVLMATVVRAALAAVVLTGVALALGMEITHDPRKLLGLYGLALLVNLAAALWSTGVAMHIRNANAVGLEILPIFLALFLTPVFLPLHKLHGWLHAVAHYNPFTRPIEAGRSLIADGPWNSDVGFAFAVMGGLVLVMLIFALWGVRRANAGGI
jgi:ABC-2 type transport system permease protein